MDVSEHKFTSAEDYAERIFAATGMTLDEFKGNSYLVPYVDPEGSVHALLPLMFTMAIVADLNRTGYGDRWCYETDTEALAAYMDWIGRDCRGEPSGWIRHPATGRRWVKDKNFCEINSF